MSDPCQQAQKALEAGQPKKALNRLKTLLKYRPFHGEAHYLAGIAWLRLANPYQALPFLQQAQQALPNNTKVQEHLAAAYINCQEYARALTVLKPIMAQPEPSILVLLNAALATFQLGREEMATHLIEQVLARDPSQAEARFLLAQIAFARHDYGKAQAEAEAGLALKPTSIDGLSMLASIHLKVKNYAESTRLYKMLYLKDSTHSGNLHNYANSLKGLGALEEAKGLYRESLQHLLSQNQLPKPKPKEPMSVDLAHQALAVFDEAMAQLKIPYFLVFGTALGVLRDGRLLPNDKDMDLALPWHTPREALINALEHYGFVYPAKAQFLQGETEGQRLISVVHCSTGISIDLFFAKRDGEFIEFGFDHKPLPLRWRLRRFGLDTITYQGRRYQVPSPHAQFFEDHYGPDWQRPQHYDGVLRGAALTPDCAPLSLCYGYSRLSTYLRNGPYKKALAYCRQMQLVTDDPLVEQAAQLVERILSAEVSS